MSPWTLCALASSALSLLTFPLLPFRPSRQTIAGSSSLFPRGPISSTLPTRSEPQMKTILAVFLTCAMVAAFHARIVSAQAPAQPDAEKPHADCEELPAVAAKLANDEKTLQDWPNLARYQDANATVHPPAKDEKRVVFMGDSMTDMWVQPQFGGFFPGKPYINRGISGQTTPQMLIRFRPDVIALQPKVVVILAGTNDIAGNTGPSTLEMIEDNLMSMAELAKGNGIKVVLSSVMPVCDYIRPQTERRPQEKIIALNTWMKGYAEKNGFIY